MIKNFNQMNTKEIELSNESSIIVYEDSIVSLNITYHNKDDILNALGGLQRYRKLAKLTCSNAQITSLPTLPKSLIKLDCSSLFFRNPITILPTLPNSLTKLICSCTSLT